MAILVFIGGALLMLLILAFSISLGIANQRTGWDIARRMKNRAAYLRGRADAYNAQAYGQPPPPPGYGPPQGYAPPPPPPEGRFE